MTMKNGPLLILFIVFFLIGSSLTALRRTAESNHPSAGTEVARQLFPDARAFNAKAQPFPYIEASDGQKVLGYAVLTADLKLNIQGYGGPVPLAIAFSPDGMVLNLVALPNNESPSYTGQLDNFLKQFINKTRQNPLALGQDIDAISRATVTSDAVTSTVKAALHRFTTEVLGDSHKEAVRTAAWHWRDVFLPFLLLAMACAALLLKNTPLRWLTMAGGFLFFGIATQTMLSIVQIANLGLGNIPGFLQSPLWYVTLIIAFIPGLIIGRIYCGALCPFVLVQEILPDFFRRFNRRAQAVSPKVDGLSRNVKYVLLFGILALCFMAGNAAAANVEPFVTLFTSHSTRTAWAFLLLMIILGIFHFRFWCVYLCPVGALTSLMANLSWWKIRPKNGCTRCGQCAAVCPTRAIKIITPATGSPASQEKILINAAECILCAKCLQNCKESQLTLRRKP